MSTKRRVRKPRDLPRKDGVYAGIERELVYIGGPYYQDSSQLHLTAKDCRRLAKWLMAASSYLEQQEKRRG